MGGRAAVRARIRVEGVVQGVGFRPFARALAARLGLAGFVSNDEGGALVEVEGPRAAVDSFVGALAREAPPLAEVERIEARSIAPTGARGFAIAESRVRGEIRALVSPDVATCEDCLREIFDPSDRRYRYAFTNCTNCGPRYTIQRAVPYDRPATTMSGFRMCAACAREYADPCDRRHHAQPLCCPACGPRLALRRRDGREEPGDPILLAAELLRADLAVAVKGLGGFHLAARAASEPAVSALRAGKRRRERPFALMAADLDAARRLVDLDDAEARCLAGSRRPILLARRRPEAGVAPSVAPGSRWLGVMLPYTPLHHLLARALGEPLVLTSGNPSDEPITYRDDDARARLASLADAFLVHDRPIHVRCDDSVVRVRRGRELPLRRARGYAPRPLALAVAAPRPVLGVGGELKSTFCLARGSHAFLSPHIGDLESYETLRSLRDGIAHFERLFDVRPEIVAHDLHPEYLSTKLALEREGVRPEGVQHHHAHAAACLAEHGERGPALALCFDGLGFGEDGTLWGGEFLVADLARYERRGRFRPAPMPGGQAAVREPWRMAAAYLDAAGAPEAAPWLAERHGDRFAAVLALARAGVNAPLSSSVGRLFDAAACLAGVRDVASYEGQAAWELEQLVDPEERGAYPARISTGDLLEVSGVDLLLPLVEDLRAGAPAARVAARFHGGVAMAAVEVCRRLRAETGLGVVALSGGVFQNAVLLARLAEELAREGFRVLEHERVPPNDGGLAFGQVAVAAARELARG